MQNNINENELIYIEKHLRLERDLSLKFQQAAKTIDDPGMSEKCRKIAAKHREHYKNLLSLLGE